MHLGKSKIAIFFSQIGFKIWSYFEGECCQEYFFYLARQKKFFLSGRNVFAHAG
jgi:hypothetical protein